MICSNIPNRPGWVSFRFVGSYAVCNLKEDCANGRVYSDWGFNLSANDTAERSYPTASLNVSLNQTGDQVQAGVWTLNPPIVSNVTVAEALSVSTGRTLFIFRHSVNDTNSSTTGDFHYPVVGQFIQEGQPPKPFPKTTPFQRGIYKLVSCGVGQALTSGLVDTCTEAFTPGTPSTTVPVFFDSFSGSGNAGLRYVNISYSGTSPFLLSVTAVPVDNATGWVGTPSCLTTVDPSKTSTVRNCGLYIAGRDINPGAPGVITPSFPGLDVPAFIASTGFAAEKAGYVLTGLLLLGLYAAGFWAGGGVAAGLASTLGAALAYYLGLLGAWVIIVVFILSAIIAVMGMMAGRGARR